MQIVMPSFVAPWVLWPERLYEIDNPILSNAEDSQNFFDELEHRPGEPNLVSFMRRYGPWCVFDFVVSIRAEKSNSSSLDWDDGRCELLTHDESWLANLVSVTSSVLDRAPQAETRERDRALETL